MSGSVNSVAVQPDGKVLIGGTFPAYDGTPRIRIARLNADGTLDTTFDPDSGPNGEVESVVLQPDGKILIGGFFTSYNGRSRNRIARLNADGSLDTTFDPGSGASDVVESIAVQPDGKILIGGNFTSYNGVARNRIARLNAIGSLDTTFDPGSGANFRVNSVAVQSDGQILIGGDFDNVGGRGRGRIARLAADGTVDTSFPLGTGANGAIYEIALQPDGKILISGFFTIYSESAINRIARLNADGLLDSTFDPGLGADGGVESFALLPNGKIVIGGRFTTVDGTLVNRIAQLNADGSLDTTFDAGTGLNNIVRKVALQPDLGVLIGGVFTEYDGIVRNRIARVQVAPPPGMPSVPAVAVTGVGKVRVTVARPSGGDVPTSFEVTASPGGATCEVAGESGSCVISGLDERAVYTFTAVASNDGGSSPSSGVSVSVTPGSGDADRAADQFRDVSAEKYYARGVDLLFQHGITTGKGSPNVFAPGEVVTRAQMATFLWRLAGEPSASACSFEDQSEIPTSASVATCWLQDNEYTTENPFNPNGQVTRAQMAAFLFRIWGPPSSPSSCEFSDESKIPLWARSATCWMKDNNITTGLGTTGNYGPREAVTRGQMAAFLYRLGGNVEERWRVII